MITFLELGRYGRLGNQLFQYAMLKSVSLARGYEIKVPNLDEQEWHGQKCLLNMFNIKCDYLTDKDKSSIQRNFVEANHTIFYPQVFYSSDNTNFHGYFQSYQYFRRFEKQIREDLSIKKKIQKMAEQYVGDLKTNNEKIVSVHIRRGDMTDGTVPKHMNYYGKGELLNNDSKFGTYFRSALKLFERQNVKFLVFSGGSRSGVDKNNQTEIEWCKKQISDERFIFCEGHSDIEDFAIMKNCDHHIVSPMTSFGYWAAYLNDKKDKIVAAPSSYSIPDDGRVKRGFYPNTWKVIQGEVFNV